MGTATIAGLWVLLTTTRPGTTYHLAPALVTWAYPYLRRSAGPVRMRRAVGAVVVGAGVATAMSLILHVAGWLEGPVLFGRDGLGEALLVVAFAAIAALGVAVASAARRRP
jgi:hypothetical protein